MDQLDLSVLATHFSPIYEIEVDGEITKAIAFPKMVQEWFSDEALSHMLVGTHLEGELQKVKDSLVTKEKDGPHPSIDPAEPRRIPQTISHSDFYYGIDKTRSRVRSLANTTIRGLNKLRFLLASMSLLLERKPVEVMYPQIMSFEELCLIKVANIYDPSDNSFDTIKMLNHAEQNPDHYIYADDDVVREEARSDREKLKSNSHIQTALGKIRTLRNKHLAHNDPKRKNIRETVKELEIALSEICLLYNLAEDIVGKYLIYAVCTPLEPTDESRRRVIDYYEVFQDTPWPRD